jgi:hypothetical protein
MLLLSPRTNSSDASSKAVGDGGLTTARAVLLFFMVILLWRFGVLPASALSAELVGLLVKELGRGRRRDPSRRDLDAEPRAPGGQGEALGSEAGGVRELAKHPVLDAGLERLSR